MCASMIALWMIMFTLEQVNGGVHDYSTLNSMGGYPIPTNSYVGMYLAIPFFHNCDLFIFD